MKKSIPHSEYGEVTPKSLLFTMTEVIACVRIILMDDFGYSYEKANICILLAIDAEKQFSSVQQHGTRKFDRGKEVV